MDRHDERKSPKKAVRQSLPIMSCVGSLLAPEVVCVRRGSRHKVSSLARHRIGTPAWNEEKATHCQNTESTAVNHHLRRGPHTTPHLVKLLVEVNAFAWKVSFAGCIARYSHLWRKHSAAKALVVEGSLSSATARHTASATAATGSAVSPYSAKSGPARRGPPARETQTRVRPE